MSSVSAVVTTGIYCRLGCGANPNPQNVHKFTLAAAAEAAGYRACLRCRPYRTEPTSHLPAPELICRSVQLILDGALDDGHTEHDLGVRLGISARHLRRLFTEHLGATPDQVARSARTHFARRLLDDTDFTIADVAFAAGFGSVRQFNREFRAVFQDTPGNLRARRRASDRLVADGGLALRLHFQPPLDWDAMLVCLKESSIPGVEHVTGTSYRRTIEVEGNPGVLELWPGGPDYLILRAHLPHWRGLIHLAQRARAILNLDANVEAAIKQLDADPIIGPLVRQRPGLRPLGTWDPFEAAIRVIVGRYVGESGAGAITAQIVKRHGVAVPGLIPIGLTHLFPPASVLATADLRGLGVNPIGVTAINKLARAVADQTLYLDRGHELDHLLKSIAAVPGIDLNAAQQIALRLGETDAFPTSTENIRRWASQALARPISRRHAAGLASNWRPNRALAATYLSSASRQ